MLESLKNLPLSLDQIPAAAQKPLSPGAPKPLKMMAANGALPIPPDALLLVWYQLSFDPDPDIAATVKETVNNFDPDLIVELAAKDYPESVLDWLSKTSNDPRVYEAIALNNKTHDATLMDLAAVAPRDIVEIISSNHVRLLRSPEIIERIYSNPASRMATIDRLLSLAKEHNVEIPGLKMVQDAHNELIADDVPGLSDEEFEDIMIKTVQAAASEKQEGLENLRVQSLEEQEASESSEQKQRRLTRSQIIERMNAPQRMRLALLGTREDRNILIRDSRRVVYMSVIQSPKMSLGEVTSIATSKSMPDEVVSYIANRRDWVRYYPIVVALVNNPKCPLADSVGFLKQLRPNDLKALQKSKSVPAQLTRQAQMLFRQKSIKG
ncbi:MAG: hypothetical protein J6A01_12100 [Proteobacteria bacterium]|nr:hypothetical protein [Pseudomonadota bacterium]